MTQQSGSSLSRLERCIDADKWFRFAGNINNCNGEKTEKALRHMKRWSLNNLRPRCGLLLLTGHLNTVA